MSTIDAIIRYARENNCSDIHLTAELPPVYRRYGDIMVSNLPYDNQEIESSILSMLDHDQLRKVNQKLDIDLCYSLTESQRQRVNIYYQQGSICACIRILNDKTPTFDELKLPRAIRELAQVPNGLVLVTGPTGSGKSTTLAAMVDYINQTRKGHIITLEDPIEYVHKHKSCIVHQREVGEDVPSFEAALKSALREDPDVILVGEMRDLETISAAVTAAETGHLVLSTLHTTGAANTIDRIIDVFPDGGKDQIRTQLAEVLRGVVTQQLIPAADGEGRHAAFEILKSTEAISSLIRENKCYQINTILQTSQKDGMCTLNNDLGRLVSSGKISLKDAMDKSNNTAELMRYLT